MRKDTLSPAEEVRLEALLAHLEQLLPDAEGPAFRRAALELPPPTLRLNPLRPQPALTDVSGALSVVDGPSNPAVSLIASGSGTLIRIQGRSLAAEEGFVGRVPGPTALAGTSATANGRPIPLLYVSSTQIWGQLPSDVQAPFLLSVINVNGSVQANVS